MTVMVEKGCTVTMQETVNKKENMAETPDSLDAAAFEEAGIVSGQTGHKSPKSKATNHYLTNEPPIQVLSRPPALATLGTAATGSAAGTFFTCEPSCQLIGALLS